MRLIISNPDVENNLIKSGLLIIFLCEMEKKILYILLIIISAYAIYQNISHRKIQYKNKSFWALKEMVDLENLCKGKIVADIKISNFDGKKSTLYNILSTYNSEYFLVIISSIKTCSACRESVLKMWNDFFKKNKNMGILIIITEEECLNKIEKRQIEASIRSLNIEIPYYFDYESLLLNMLGIGPYQTPLSLILTHDKKIIAVDKTNALTEDRTIDFKKFFILLNSPGG